MVDEYFYFQHYYPKYFDQFKKRFERFLCDWEKLAKNKGELENKKDYLLGFTAKLLLLIIHSRKSNRLLVRSFENGDKKITRDENAALEYFIEEVLFVPDIIIRTFARSNKVYNYTKQKLINELEEMENKRSKYDPKIFKRAYELQQKNINKRPKLTNIDAVFKAMIELGADEGDLLKAGKPTPYLSSVVASYENYHKKKLNLKTKKPNSILVNTKTRK